MKYIVFFGLGLLPILMVASAIYIRLPPSQQWRVLCLTHISDKAACNEQGWHRFGETPAWRNDE